MSSITAQELTTTSNMLILLNKCKNIPHVALIQSYYARDIFTICLGCYIINATKLAIDKNEGVQKHENLERLKKEANNNCS